MKRKIARGQELTELVKGSLDYTLNEIREAFYQQFPAGENQPEYWINETFSDHLIVSEWTASELSPDEYYQVTYEKNGDDYIFAARDAWEVVELTYQPQTRPETEAEMGERQQPPKRGKGKRFDERLGAGALQLQEAQAGNENGPWKIKAIGITANVINGNGRRYKAEVLREAVEEAQTHLTESFSQGRLVITGEPEHPTDKGTGRPTLLETVANWTGISFDGTHVLLEGLLLGTSAGRDIHAQMVGGVMPDVSQRAKGESRTVKAGDQLVEEVEWCRITGYDLVANGYGSDPAAGITFSESQQTGEPTNSPQPQENEAMDAEKLMELIKANPDLFKGIVLEEVEKMGAAQLKALEETVRKALGIGPEADLGKELAEAAKAKRELEESKREKAVEIAIVEQTKSLAYDKDMNESFVEAVRAAKPQSEDAVKALVEAKRSEYDKLASKMGLKRIGFSGKGGVQATAPVLERELGIPEFARGMHEITERFVKTGFGKRHDWTKPVTKNEEMTLKLLERFDTVYMNDLRREAKLLEEAETTADLNLPYSVSRTIIAQVGPQLVAASVFDFDVVNQSPFYIFYETYAAESGAVVTITDESVTTDLDDWVNLAHSRLIPGTVVVTSSPAGTTYVENTDYIIEYANGRLMTLSTGTPISNGAAVLVDYQYDAIRKGEMATIERGKGTLAYKTMEAKADRLADQVSSEAMVFGQSQLGWDATARTLNMLIFQIRRKIDRGIFRMALSAALSVASNSGGTWNSGASPIDYADLVKKLGIARVKITNRYYEPTGYVMSATMSDMTANWEGFTAAGKRPDSDLNATGYVGRLKGLPVFETTEFPDTHVLAVNRELVAHRVFRPLRIDGPHKSRDATTNQLISAEEYFVEEYNATEAPVPGKGAYIVVS